MKPNIHSQEQFATAYGSRRPAFYSSTLATIVRDGKPGPILDLGAGLGLFAELAQTWGLNIVALEGSEYAVTSARTRCPSLDIRVHDLGDALPFEANSIANVALNQVIEHIDPDRFDKVLQETYRILEPGGRLFIWSPSSRNVKERDQPTHINLIMPSALRAALLNSGFTILAEPNSGFWFAPNPGRVGALASRILARILSPDWVVATANAVAGKQA